MSGIVTYGVSVVTLLIYFMYILVVKGIVGLLFSSAIFLIAFSFTDSIEYVTALVVLLGLAIVMALKAYEGFNDANTGMAIEQRVMGWTKAYKQSEGFEDAKESIEEEKEANPIVDAKLKSEENGQNPTESKPANPDINPMDKTPLEKLEKDVKSNLMPENIAKAKNMSKGLSTSPAANADPINKSTLASASAPATAEPALKSTAGFEGNPGLFKLGEMPSDSKSGPFVDVASTMSHAVNSLQPEQMAAMTMESQKLLETQKSLMGMLQSMRPVLQDGRQLLDTFSGIFGGMGKGGITGPLPQMDLNAGKV